MAKVIVWGFRSSAERETRDLRRGIELGTASTVQELDAIIARGEKKFYAYVDYFDSSGNRIYLYDQAVKLLMEDASELVAAARSADEYFAAHLAE